jgi:hypothetical protein
MNPFIKYLIIFWLSFFALVLSMAATRHVLSDGPRITGTSKEIILFLAELPLNTWKLMTSGITKPLVIQTSFPLKNGFTFTGKNLNSKDYLLLSVWDDTLNQSIIKLVRIEDGKILHKWIPDIDSLNQLFNSTEKGMPYPELEKSATQLLHPFLLNDGSLIVSAGGLFKIDKNAHITWSNANISHHSIELDPDSNIWMCGLNSSFINTNKFQIRDESIKKISIKNGKTLFEKSVFEILMENGYERGCFFINSFSTTLKPTLDYVHLNDVQPVLKDSKYWKKGDLFLSLRQQNLVLLYRPSSNKIIWHQNGPWLKQHNVDILDSTKIGIFGNNVLDADFSNPDNRLLDGHNIQYVYDFSTNELLTPYEEFFKSSSIRTCTEGRSRILNNGNIFIEETNQGRLLFGNNKSAIWSYIEKINDKEISIPGWCRYITEEEFEKIHLY